MYLEDGWNDFYKWWCRFEGYTLVEGKVMMSRLCSCEVEGFIVIRLYANPTPCHDYEHCIDLYCFDMDLFCLKLKPGDRVKAKIDIYGEMRESREKRIYVPPANKKEFYRITGKVISPTQVDFDYFTLNLEDCRIPKFVEYVDIEADFSLDEIETI